MSCVMVLLLGGLVHYIVITPAGNSVHNQEKPNRSRVKGSFSLNTKRSKINTTCSKLLQ